MVKKLLQPSLSVKKSLIHGYGVFAEKNFKKNEIIEECYTILSDGSDKGLKRYYFAAEGDHSAVPTGFGLIYNHSDQPNLTYDFDEIHSLLIFKAIRRIKKGEELCHSYGKNWFASRNLVVKKIPRWIILFRYLKGVFARFIVVVSGIYCFIYIMNRLA